MNAGLNCATMGNVIDLVVNVRHSIGKFRLPVGTTEDVAREVSHWCGQTRLLELWSSSRRSAALTLHTTAALIAEHAIEVAASERARAPEDLNRVLDAVRNSSVDHPPERDQGLRQSIKVDAMTLSSQALPGIKIVIDGVALGD